MRARCRDTRHGIGPVRLRWYLEVERIDEAHALERRIHGWRRDKKLALIEGRVVDLPRLARTRTPR